ncbi:extracellular solute-binding protein [Pontibacillus sp. HMF3514]|uniref:extracellular solute-binding protein n=1 Tax=Pontibacillus sp. HMF3514 TaxID=2692425 RepID=UPI00131F926C|nr:extracellular solute-binding protein [Pontibacillus sp. HMF3514]QHE53661.1 extracellular solute-binding protein [Pontibacillus sp. HMF3514]
MRLKSMIRGLILTLLLAAILVGCDLNSEDENVSSLEEESHVQAVNPDEPGWKVDTSPVTFDWYVNFSWFTTKWGNNEVSNYITDKTGVSINFISPSGNENEKMNTMMASGSLPDFITIGWWEDAAQKIIEQDLVLPLDDLAEEYDPYFFKVADDTKLEWYRQEDGHVYGYPNASSSPEDFERYKDLKPSNQTFLVRKDIYEALGKPDMRTPEGFLNALREAKERFPEVNGEPLIPIGLHEFTSVGNDSIDEYLQSFLAIPKEKNGNVYDRLTDPEYIKWLKTFRKANEMGLLSKDIFIDKRAQMEEKIAQGRYFAMLYQRSDMAAQQLDLYAKDPDKVYIAVDGPANSNLDTPTLPADGISGWTITLISKDVKDPERAIRFLSYLISEEGQKDTFLGKEGVTWHSINGDEHFSPEVLNLLKSDRISFDQKYGAAYTYWMLMDTNKMLEWTHPTAPPLKQLEDWTKGKTVSISEFEGIEPTGTSKEGIAANKIDKEWGRTLPKLLLAKSDEEFDRLFQLFLQKRKDYGYDLVEDYKQNQYEENKRKLNK